MIDDIRLGIEKQHVTLILLFDFSKAFDVVCHIRLLKKLLDYDFSRLAIRWIASYLSDCEQAVFDGIGNYFIFTYPKTYAKVSAESVIWISDPLQVSIWGVSRQSSQRSDIPSSQRSGSVFEVVLKPPVEKKTFHQVAPQKNYDFSYSMLRL